MLTERTYPDFTSVLAQRLRAFLDEKRTLGHAYRRESLTLKHFDRRLCAIGMNAEQLPRDIVEPWTAAQPWEKPASQQHRVTVIRQFARYLVRCGIDAYVPPEGQGPVRSYDYAPHIFSREEIADLLRAADHLRPEGHSPLLHYTMPEIFRLLYGCGFRVGEVLKLRVGDVDLARGVLTIRDAKFGKDRLVPVADSMRLRLETYAARVLPTVTAEAYFFPARDGGPQHQYTVYRVFRGLLRTCGTSHGGRGKGPRLHDLRHTFAVHCLERWYREGADIGAKLPFLSVYMGHRSLAGTERYLRLTPHVFPDIVERMDTFAGSALPRRERP